MIPVAAGLTLATAVPALAVGSTPTTPGTSSGTAPTSSVGGAISGLGLAIGGHLSIEQTLPPAPKHHNAVRKHTTTHPSRTHRASGRTSATSTATTAAGSIGTATTSTTSTTSTSTTGGAGTTGTADPVAAVPNAGTALSPFESRVLVLVNGARTAAGLHPLRAVAGATDVARRWAQQLAEAGALSHNPSLVNDLSAAGSQNWHIVEENVGAGPAGDADALFAAYMASPHHRANILDPAVTVIGVGAIAVSSRVGATAWNVLDFSDSYDMGHGPAVTSPVASVISKSALASLFG